VISSPLQCSIAAIKFAAASVSGVVGKHHQPSAGIQARIAAASSSDWSTVWRRRTSLS
jgi:hypothetical protein